MPHQGNTRQSSFVVGKSKSSLLGRLLWPINMISFVLLVCICALSVYRAQNEAELAMRSKAEGMATFLRLTGQIYVANYDLGSLENFTKFVLSDADFQYVVFFNQNGQAMTESSKMIEDSSVTKIEQPIQGADGTVIGRIAIGYKRDRIDVAFWSMLKIGIYGLVLTQLFLSIAVFFVSRGIVEPLVASLRQLSLTTNVLSKTSDNVSKFSEALSTGVRQQAAVVLQTNSSMSEMSTMLTQTSAHAKQCDTLMTSVSQRANDGMRVMIQMVEAMSSAQQANEHLKQIVEIIAEIDKKTKVINEIVFKTQILSFNASIEAARAGVSGRGFAVVAEEVGNLAKLSGHAAQEISSLLADSEKQVNEILRDTSERVLSSKSVGDQAMKGFQHIANDIALVTNQISSISAATREQELGVAQTNSAMAELTDTTDLNNRVAQSAQDTAAILASEVKALTQIATSIENSISAGNAGPASPGDDAPSPESPAKLAA